MTNRLEELMSIVSEGQNSIQRREIEDYINQLQSNWNSLIEELYQANRELVPNELVNGKELINNILDKMNELEGKDNDGK